MQVVRLQPGDAEPYLALRLRGMREHPQAFTSSYNEERHKSADWARQRLASPHSAFWGVLEDGRLAGVVGLDRETRAQNRHKATVVGMFVAPEYTGRGFGLALLDALLAHARSEGVQLLVLTVTVGNDGARRLYERAGFKSFGVEPHAVHIDGRFHDKEHLFLLLGST